MVSRCFLVLNLLIAGVSSAARAQSYTCLSDTAMYTRVMYNDVVSLVTGTDSTTVRIRNAYQLPAVSASKVSVVTMAAVCTKAGKAYHAAVASSRHAGGVSHPGSDQGEFEQVCGFGPELPPG